jgi:hypothetical protein
MDFYKIKTKESKDKVIQVYPDWVVGPIEDLMVRGGSFYAVWDEARGMWSTNEFDVQRIVDADLRAFVDEYEEKTMRDIMPLYTRDFGTGSWERFNRYIRNLPVRGTYHPLDETFTFENTEVKKKDFVSKRLPYSLEEGKTDAWDELVSVLYSSEELDKIEWAIGSIVAGDSKWIQKFLVFYGPPATGKSTIIGIIGKLFEGYTATFEAKALTGNGSFGMDSFEHNPLVAIQHDGDLSKIEDNSKLNSIVGHDEMTINIKYKSSFTIKSNAFLIMGTNKPVKITDAKAGSTRRLIDIHPTGAKIEPERYHILVENVNYELGAIAHKCRERYRKMGKFYFERYIPTKMMMLTDTFYNFVEAHFDILKAQDGIQLKRCWDLYKEYCEEANIVKRLQYHEVRDELASYFEDFKDRHVMGDKEYRSVYVGFKGLPEQGPTPFVPDTSYVIELQEYDPEKFGSAFNNAYPDQPAQQAKASGFPGWKWEKVTTTLSDIDTTELHFVKVPEKHIVLDFDLVDEDGNKDLEQNIEAASKFPPTYTELSKSGSGLHLHYIYSGVIGELASAIDTGIEIKTLLGDSSLRRKLTKCNNLDIAILNGGLPKKEKKMLDNKTIQTEKGLRELIERNLRKEIHPGTKPSVDFIHHILQEAYDSGMAYDLTDMRPTILAFAARSSNQASASIKIVQSMKFAGKSDDEEPEIDDKPLVFFDVEVYPNLFVVCWKSEGSDKVVRMINPTGEEIEPLFSQKLVGFNNRRYDNHILYARYLGHSIEELYNLSQEIINSGYSNNSPLFGKAYGISYADIYDFSSKKQGLKKFQIELGIHHHELDLPWDQPVEEGIWSKVEEYCVNDVISTEAVFNARKQDFVARQILAELSGLSVNHTTQQHTARIIFGTDKNPQKKFVYTDLSEEFPGYKFDGKESTYCDEITGEGGYVYSEPGFYRNVALLDVASMHPTSIERLNLFGPYTERYSALKEARMAIKRKDYAVAANLLDGKLAKFLGSPEDESDSGEALSYALKIVINIVYGLTSARFDNAFKDFRNKDNIVAKRGALFMIDLKNAVMDRGWEVCHIKTDSIKIPNATAEAIDFVIEFGKGYGYDFEHEKTYDKLCLVNDAVYVARDALADHKWTAVGAQFQHPYVFKELFSGEPLEFDDLCETKNVTQGTMYLDKSGAEDVADMQHVGRTGSFMPVRYDGGQLWRVKDGKKYHVTGTKGYEWVEREVAMFRDQVEDDLFTDMDYFEKLKAEAIKAIEEFVPYEEFVKEN